MTLLEFARGPGMQWALVIFVLGVAWRLVGIALLLGRKDLARARGDSTFKGGAHAVVMYSLPPHEMEKRIVFQHIVGYAWHLGYFATVLLFGPHNPFFKSLLGFGWPTLPNTYVLIIGAITLGLMAILLVRKMVNPVLRTISVLDDYISLIVTILPLLLGFMAYAHVGRYETTLALHLLSVELLLVWFPFGKLMHLFLAIPSRFVTGAVLKRKGVTAP